MVVNRDRIVVADTNIISYVFKREPLGAQYNHLLTGREIRLAFVTVGELNSWAEDNNWGARRRLELRTFLSRFHFLATEGLRVISANPDVLALQSLPYGQRPLDMDLHCRCSL